MNGQVIPSSVSCISEVLIIEEKPLEDGKLLPIINASKRCDHYRPCTSTDVMV